MLSFHIYSDSLLSYASSFEETIQDFVYIEFHCLLSIQQWGFDDSSQVFMRFAALQNFSCCYGPMERVRYVYNKLLKHLFETYFL